MAILPQPGAQPIPGYELLERLGTGGYGEVWKATAPGGLTKAIKIIYGHLRDSRAEQEFKALGRMKEVRHPFLLSLERVEVIEDQVFIVTELADLSLQDRFQACVASGARGIPRDELLTYLRDAADALDYMNEQYGLQHLDIKPQNLLLVGRHIKIADFGLVKDLYGQSTTATGGVTPIYAPPEAFDGRVSRHSDQYSLAIVYQEMLTGVRPFPGTTALQLAAQHTTSPPLLDSLPPRDRPVIARALAKVPELRFPSCRSMVEALLRADAPPPAAQRPPPTPTVPSRAADTPPELGTESVTSLLDSPTEANPELVRQIGLAGARRPRGLTPVPGVDLIRWRGARPMLFLGIGGTAGQLLRCLKRRLTRRYGSLAKMPVFRLLLLDTDSDALIRARQGSRDEALTVEETALLPLHPPEHYRAQAKEILRWLERRWLYGIPRTLLTEGLRPLGRLALVTHEDEVRAQLRTELGRLLAQDARAIAVRTSGRELRTLTPRIFVIGSIAGGTGSGAMIDLGYLVRRALLDLDAAQEGPCALLLHSTRHGRAAEELARANAYATLAELRHARLFPLTRVDAPPSRQSELETQVPPFDECYFLDLGRRLDESALQDACDTVAEYLECDAMGITGGFLDQYRLNSRLAPLGSRGDATLRTFGLFRLTFPRDLLVDAAGNLLCGRLVKRWRLGTSTESKTALPGSPDTIATSMGLELDALGQRAYQAMEEVLGLEPAAYCRKLIADSPLGQKPLPPPAMVIDAGTDLITQLERIFGTGSGAEDPSLTPTVLETTLRAQARRVGNELTAAVEGIVRSHLEGSHGSFPAAVLAVTALESCLRERSERADQELGETRTARQQRQQRLATGDFASRKSGIRWLPFAQRAEARRGPAPKFEEYCGARLRELALESALTVLRMATARLSALAQDFLLCRQKLGHLADLFADPAALPAGRPSRGPSNLLELLPEHAKTVAHAAESLVEHLEPVLGPQFEQLVRPEILESHGGLFGLALAGEDPAEVLRDPLHALACRILREALQDVDAAQLFLTMYADPRKAEDALRGFARGAMPEVAAKDSSWRHLIVTLPESDAGRLLKDRITEALKREPVSILDSEGDVSFCWEVAQVPLDRALSAVQDNEMACAEMGRRLLTRIDVDWRLPEEKAAE